MCVIHLRKTISHRVTDRFRSLPLSVQTIKRHRHSFNSKSEYLYIRFLQPASNMCDRFFSIAGYSLNNQNCRLWPVNLECQLIFSVNKHLWNIPDVHNCILDLHSMDEGPDADIIVTDGVHAGDKSMDSFYDPNLYPDLKIKI